MADILSPTGIEKPLGGEPHSRAQYLRNLDRINQVAIDLAANQAEDKKIRHAEFTGGAIPYPSSAAQWGVGVLSPDTGSTPNVTINNTFVSYLSSDTLKILETGLYLFQWALSGTSLPPAGEMAIKNGTTGNYINNDDLANGVSWTAPLQGTAYCVANDPISFFTFNRAAAFTGSSRIKVTKLQG